MERIVVAFSHEEAQRRILRLLESAGCPPAACCSSVGLPAGRAMSSARCSTS